jgi:hypothetical protein
VTRNAFLIRSASGRMPNGGATRLSPLSIEAYSAGSVVVHSVFGVKARFGRSDHARHRRSVMSAAERAPWLLAPKEEGNAGPSTSLRSGRDDKTIHDAATLQQRNGALG